MVGEVDINALQAQLAPVTRQDKGQLVSFQGAVMMGKTNPAIELELRIALQSFLQPWHADQDDTDACPIKDVPDVLEGLLRQALNRVDDQHFDRVALVAWGQDLFWILGQVDTDVQAGHKGA